MIRERPWKVPLSTNFSSSAAVFSEKIKLVVTFTRVISRPALKVGGCTLFAFLHAIHYVCTTLVLPPSSDSDPGSRAGPLLPYGYINYIDSIRLDIASTHGFSGNGILLVIWDSALLFHDFVSTGVELGPP